MYKLIQQNVGLFREGLPKTTIDFQVFLIFRPQHSLSWDLKRFYNLRLCAMHQPEKGFAFEIP